MSLLPRERDSSFRGGPEQPSEFIEPQLQGALRLIAAERSRQIQLGYDSAHDDRHTNDELMEAAAVYWLAGDLIGQGHPPDEAIEDSFWPWEEEAYRPSQDRIENYVKAVSLMAAEIDRLLRLQSPRKTEEYDERTE